MSQPEYRGTRIFLTVVSILMAIGGALMIFSTKGLVIRAAMSPPASEISTLMLFMTKESLIWVRSISRLIVAGVFYWIRPKHTASWPATATR